MEVLKDNFESLVETILHEIDNSDFASIDLEMTGINMWTNNILDYPEERYGKCKSVAEKYKIIQVGMCLFKRITNSNGEIEIEARPYNFYVFPEENSGNNNLNCETGAIIFNREHKMDFNKWIYQGIPYINAKFEKNLTDNLMDDSMNYISDKVKKTVQLHKEEDKQKYLEFMESFNKFIQSDEETMYGFKHQRYVMTHILNSINDELKKKIYFEYENMDGKQVLKISKVSEEKRNECIEQELGDKMKSLDKKKGHNCLLDTLFMISSFGDQLPNTLKEYKALLRSNFTSTFDTKLIFENLSDHTNDTENEKSNLENIYSFLKEKNNKKIQIKIPENFPNFNSDVVDSSLYHSAGFDAYITGVCFVFMEDIIGDKIEKYSNKLNLMRSLFSCFDLNGEDPYVFPNAKTYCLKAVKNVSDIDTKKYLPEHLQAKIKKSYVANENMALILLVELNSMEIIDEFDKQIKEFPQLFNVYNLQKFKEAITDEANKKKKDKKYEKKDENHH